jgi:hypothetical protein
MTTNPTEPKIRVAAIYFDVPTVWVDQFETTDRRGQRVVVEEWTGAIDDDGNVMDGNRYATGFIVHEDGTYGNRVFRDLYVRRPPTSRRQWTRSAPSDRREALLCELVSCAPCLPVGVHRIEAPMSVKGSFSAVRADQ